MIARLLMASRIQSARWAFNCGSWSPSEEDWQLLSSGLDAEDKDQVGKFVFQKDAKLAMAGRFLTKKFVCEATGLSWKDIKILRDSEHRKPYLPQTLFSDFKVQFNVSHSGDFVIFAGEIGDVHLGVDVMRIERQRTTSVSEFFRMMNKQFAPEEWAVVKAQETEAEQMAMFYRFWCLKESFTKATGTGISVDLQKISFKLKTMELSESVVTADTEVFIEGKKQERWKFEESLLGHTHIATVASCRSDVCESSTTGQLFTVLSYPELISHFQQISEIDFEYCSKFIAKKRGNSLYT